MFLTTPYNRLDPMQELDYLYRTAFSDLEQRAIDGAFASDFPPGGWFANVKVKGRDYIYYERSVEGRPVRSYVGPAEDAAVAERVARHKEISEDLRARRDIVNMLVHNARLPRPDRFVGDVVGALAAAGVFRLRGVLVGTVAYQTYAGLLGVKMPQAGTLATSDADFAQFYCVSHALGDSLPPVLDLLRRLDPTFRDVPHAADGRYSVAFANRKGFRVEFLTPNTGKAESDGKPAPMPALGGAAAQPLRFLDFLIHRPVRTVLLHGGGIPVTVPAPERYAVHKLIVAVRRNETSLSKARKDLDQARDLIQALELAGRQAELADAFEEARSRGPSWRGAIERGMGRVWGTSLG